MDLPDAADAAARFASALNNKIVMRISALSGDGIVRLISYLDDMLGRNDE